MLKPYIIQGKELWYLAEAENIQEAKEYVRVHDTKHVVLGDVLLFNHGTTNVGTPVLQLNKYSIFFERGHAAECVNKYMIVEGIDSKETRAKIQAVCSALASVGKTFKDVLHKDGDIKDFFVRKPINYDDITDTTIIEEEV